MPHDEAARSLESRPDTSRQGCAGPHVGPRDVGRRQDPKRQKEQREVHRWVAGQVIGVTTRFRSNTSSGSSQTGSLDRLRMREYEKPMR